MTHPLMAKEFPDFDQATLPTIPAGFEDTSWHNDACPSFQHEGLGLHLFIDYADPDDREMGSPFRFRVDQLVKQSYIDNDGKDATVWEWPDDGADTLVAESDDWMVVFDAIRFAAHKAVKAGTVEAEALKGLLYEVELPAQAYAPITDLESAVQWVKDMTVGALIWHFDDSVDSIINDHGDLFREEDYGKMRAKVDELYGLDLAPYGCPHGLAIAAAKEVGKWDFWTPRDLLEFANGLIAEVVEVDPANRKRAILKIQHNGQFMAAETSMELVAEDSWTDLQEGVEGWDGENFATVEEARAFLTAHPAEA